MHEMLDTVLPYDELQVLDSDDIDTSNRYPPPGWSQVVYRLGTGAFHYSATRVDLGGGVALEHARFLGATRLVGTLEADAVHVLFPYGRDLRLRGVPIGQRLVVATPPGASFEGATQAEGCGRNIVVRGRAYAELCARLEESAVLSRWCSEQTVFAETPASEALRVELEGYFDLLARRPDLALHPQAKAYARTNFLDLAGQALVSLRTDPPSIVEASCIPSRALALAGRTLDLAAGRRRGRATGLPGRYRADARLLRAARTAGHRRPLRHQLRQIRAGGSPAPGARSAAAQCRARDRDGDCDAIRLLAPWPLLQLLLRDVRTATVAHRATRHCPLSGAVASLKPGPPRRAPLHRVGKQFAAHRYAVNLRGARVNLAAAARLRSHNVRFAYVTSIDLGPCIVSARQ